MVGPVIGKEEAVLHRAQPTGGARGERLLAITVSADALWAALLLTGVLAVQDLSEHTAGTLPRLATASMTTLAGSAALLVTVLAACRAGWARTFDPDGARATTGDRLRLGAGVALMAAGLSTLALGDADGLWIAAAGYVAAMAAHPLAAGGGQPHGNDPMTTATVSMVMAREPRTLAASLSVHDAMTSGFERQLFTAFPVVDGTDRVVGLITLSDVRAVPLAERAQATVGQVMCTDADVIVPGDTELAGLIARPAFARRGRAVVIDEDRRPVGLLSVTDVRTRFGIAVDDPALPSRG